MNFQSLNSAIRSVTNSQLNLKEDIQTSERKQEMSMKRKKLEKRFETSAMLPKDSLGIWAHGNKDAAEKKSKQMYGKGGKIVKKTTTMKEEQEYIEMLESALESIAEELECSVEDLLEDLPPKSYVDKIKKKTQDARDAEQKKKLASSQSAYIKSTNSRTDSKGKKLDPYDDYQS
jgi:hypothetical protein